LDKVRADGLAATATSLLHRNVHRLKFKLPSEHATAHDPIVDLKHLNPL
jgi:hypothetical protein